MYIVMFVGLYAGFQHQVLGTFCKCEPEAVTLVRYNMWPATPKNPTLAIHRDLMEWLQALLLEGCIGVDAFCRAIDVRRGNRISKQVRCLLNNITYIIHCTVSQPVSRPH